MKSFAQIIIATAVNALGLLAAAHWISGIAIRSDFPAIAAMAFTPTALNAVLRPILKLILGPIIVITFGIGIIFVNAIILYILDKLFQNLTIATIPALLYASLIVGLINLVFHLAVKK